MSSEKANRSFTTLAVGVFDSMYNTLVSMAGTGQKSGVLEKGGGGALRLRDSWCNKYLGKLCK